MNIKDYYLDIDLVFLLEKNKCNIIVDMYKQMLNSSSIGDADSTGTYFNTLLKSGYLKKSLEKEDKKVEIIRG